MAVAGSRRIGGGRGVENQTMSFANNGILGNTEAAADLGG